MRLPREAWHATRVGPPFRPQDKWAALSVHRRSERGWAGCRRIFVSKSRRPLRSALQLAALTAHHVARRAVQVLGLVGETIDEGDEITGARIVDKSRQRNKIYKLELWYKDDSKRCAAPQSRACVQGYGAAADGRRAVGSAPSGKARGQILLPLAMPSAVGGSARGP